MTTVAQRGFGLPLGLAAETDIVCVALFFIEMQECVSHGGFCQSQKPGQTSYSRLDYLHGAPGELFRKL